MRTFIPSKLFILTVLVTLPFLAAPSLAEVEIYTESSRFVPKHAAKVEVNLAFGEVQIEGTDSSEIGIDFRLTCKRADLDKCKRRGERIRVVPRIKKNKFLIGLRNTPRGKIQGLRAHIKVLVPSHLPIDVDMMGGDVFVTRMSSDVEIFGGGGDVDVVAPHDTIGNVSVKVAVGKAELWMGDGHMKGGGFPRSIRWRGPGSSRINIDLGTGDARVRLE